MKAFLTFLLLLTLPALVGFQPPPVQTNVTVNIRDTNYSTYYIYYGPSTGNYTNRIVAQSGQNVLYSTSKANTYYIVAAGLMLQFNTETPLSNEIVRKSPTPLAFVPPIFTVSFSVTNPSGNGFYRIQFSPDLVNWISSGSNVPTLNIKRVQ